VDSDLLLLEQRRISTAWQAYALFSEVAPALVTHHTYPIVQRGGADESRPR
jgi:hypothetical protein